MMLIEFRVRYVRMKFDSFWVCVYFGLCWFFAGEGLSSNFLMVKLKHNNVDNRLYIIKQSAENK